jgi:hypothetical protein
MGGKGGKAEAPDYGSIAAASKDSVEMQSKVAQEQLAWAKEQYALDRGVSDRVIDQMMSTMESEAEAAAADRKRYQEVFQPVEDRLVQDALADRDRYEQKIRPLEDMMLEDSVADRNRYRAETVPLEQALMKDAAEYNTQAKQEQMAGRATGDVSMAFEAARKGALANLESFGVDPSQTRAGALDLGVRTAQAAAAAGAANDARLRVEDTGRLLRMDAINVGRATGVDATARGASLGADSKGAVGNAVNVGRGYPGQVASAFQTSQGAGQSAVQSGLATTGSGVNSMGSGVQWQQGANGVLGNWGNQVTSQKNAASQAASAQSGQTAGMVGSLIGGAAGFMVGGPMGAGLGASLGGGIGGKMGGAK